MKKFSNYILKYVGKYVIFMIRWVDSRFEFQVTLKYYLIFSKMSLIFVDSVDNFGKLHKDMKAPFQSPLISKH